MLDGVGMWLGENVAELEYTDLAGGNVFIDHLPSTPDRCVAVLSSPADEPDSRLPYDPMMFTIIVRSEQGGVWAREVSAAIYNKLHGKRNVVLPDGTYVVFILATTASPFPLGPDEAARVRLSTDYRSEVLNHTEERP